MSQREQCLLEAECSSFLSDNCPASKQPVFPYSQAQRLIDMDGRIHNNIHTGWCQQERSRRFEKVSGCWKRKEKAWKPTRLFGARHTCWLSANLSSLPLSQLLLSHSLSLHHQSNTTKRPITSGMFCNLVLHYSPPKRPSCRLFLATDQPEKLHSCFLNK